MNNFKIDIKTSFGIILLFIMSQIFGIPIMFLIEFFPKFYSLLFPLGYSLPYLFVFLLIYFYFKNYKKQSIKLKIIIPDFRLIFISIFLFIFCYLFTEYIVENLPNENSLIFKKIDELTSLNTVDFVKNYLITMKKQFEHVYYFFDNYPISALITIGFIGPILEEILFRGIILQGLLNQKIKPLFAIIFSSFLFSIVHFNPWQMIGAFILGTNIGYIYYKTNSLIMSILIHIINNLSLGILYLIYKKDNIVENLNFNPTYIFIIGLFGFIIFSWILKITALKIQNGK